jgi:integrase
MPKRTPLDLTNLRKIQPGAWVWNDGIGYRADTRGGGSWYVKYWAPVPGHYPEGVRPPVRQVKERLPNCRNRSQAEGVLMARRSAIFEGTYRPRRKAHVTTLADFTPRFLDSKRHLSTVSKYRLLLKKYLVPHFGIKPLAAISNRDCLDYYNSRLDTDAAIATVNGEMACLKSLFSEAIRTGICQENPVRGIKLLNPNNIRDRLLSEDETARLFAAANEATDYVRPLFYVLYFTGMRRGEALELRWTDVEPVHDRIAVRDSKNGEGRKVPLRHELADELFRWKSFTGGSQWVFPGRYRSDVPMNTIRPGWIRLSRSAGVSNLRPHDLRHNFTSMLQVRGVSDAIIMSITGHKTHVMLHRYSHANDVQRLAAVENLPRPVAGERRNVLKLPKRRGTGR